MKYTRLTKEQFEELTSEFTNFLAAQSIDKAEWDKIKQDTPEVAEQELDVFSDLIWEGVLANAAWLEHYSKNYIFLFKCNEKDMETIIIRSLVPEVDFLTKQGLQWLSDNIFTPITEVQRGSKSFDGMRSEAIFNIIQQGAILSSGDLYVQIEGLLEA